MLQKLFVFLILFQLLPDLFLYKRFVVRYIQRRWGRLLYWVPTTLLLAGLLYLVFFANNDFSENHTQLIGAFSILFFLFTSPKLVLATCTALSIPFHKWLSVRTRPFIVTGIVLALLNIVFILYGCFIGYRRLEVKEVTFTSSRLPQAFDGYRIVQLSDLHIGSWKGNEEVIQQMVQLVNAQQPDLIVFTGDLVNHRAVELAPFQAILSQLKAKDGVYSILGNHDYGPYFHWNSPTEQEANLIELGKRQASMGWKLLNNTHDWIVAGTDTLALIGVENEGEPPFSQHGDLSKAMAGTEKYFQVLLSHNPTHWKREVLPHSTVDLMLAGHTHGMQFQLGNYSPSSHIYPEWSGLYQINQRGLYVNVGIGYVGLPFRFGAWPEITVLTLRR